LHDWGETVFCISQMKYHFKTRLTSLILRLWGATLVAGIIIGIVLTFLITRFLLFCGKTFKLLFLFSNEFLLISLHVLKVLHGLFPSSYPDESITYGLLKSTILSAVTLSSQQSEILIFRHWRWSTLINIISEVGTDISSAINT